MEQAAPKAKRLRDSDRSDPTTKPMKTKQQKNKGKSTAEKEECTSGALFLFLLFINTTQQISITAIDK